MKVFLTGGAGYIGSITAEMLLDAGHEVIIFDNLERGHMEAVDPRSRFIKGDLRNREEVLDAMARTKPEAVMHFAAFALVGESMEFPMRYFRNNVVGGIHLVEAMVENSVKKIIFSSTCATYGEPDQTPMTEEIPQRPTNPYGESKRMLETIILWEHERHGLKPVFLRYFNACGATEKYGEHHDPETHLIPNVLAVALGRRDEVNVFGNDYPTPDGTCIRDYIHIMDLAQAHILALSADTVGAFNLGTGEGMSVMEVIDTARKITGHPIPIQVSARRPGDPARLVAGAQKAKTVLGWAPKYGDLQTIIQHAWNWHQAHPNGYSR